MLHPSMCWNCSMHALVVSRSGLRNSQTWPTCHRTNNPDQSKRAYHRLTMLRAIRPWNATSHLFPRAFADLSLNILLLGHSMLVELRSFSITHDTVQQGSHQIICTLALPRLQHIPISCRSLTALRTTTEHNGLQTGSVKHKWPGTWPTGTLNIITILMTNSGLAIMLVMASNATMALNLARWSLSNAYPALDKWLQNCQLYQQCWAQL